ncbi:MAG: hypothetical protein LUG57_06170, partial [Oscillospiraceae bacterium]|nr:hypothetical protein [Oscillospiraceae bacterium]
APVLLCLSSRLPAAHPFASSPCFFTPVLLFYRFFRYTGIAFFDRLTGPSRGPVLLIFTLFLR